jgi:hypothetical protein
LKRPRTRTRAYNASASAQNCYKRQSSNQKERLPALLPISGSKEIPDPSFFRLPQVHFPYPPCAFSNAANEGKGSICRATTGVRDRYGTAESPVRHANSYLPFSLTCPNAQNMVRILIEKLWRWFSSIAAVGNYQGIASFLFFGDEILVVEYGSIRWGSIPGSGVWRHAGKSSLRRGSCKSELDS